MKSFIYIFILTLGMISCNSDNDISLGEVEFIAKYSATITVGGIVGIMERTFEIGEIYKATDKEEDTITIRIAEHSELNDDCPNSSCYQEFLEVPMAFLKFVD